jgi:hypothetical protein
MMLKIRMRERWRGERERKQGGIIFAVLTTASHELQRDTEPIRCASSMQVRLL